MLRIRNRADLKCTRHPRFDPSRHGRGAIKGNCAACSKLADIAAASEQLMRMIRTADQQQRLIETAAPERRKELPVIYTALDCTCEVDPLGRCVVHPQQLALGIQEAH